MHPANFFSLSRSGLFPYNIFENEIYICTPITFNNPLKACFSNKKCILYIYQRALMQTFFFLREITNSKGDFVLKNGI